MTALLIKVTFALTMSLLSVHIARRSRAAVRHALLASGFAIVLLLPMASMVSPMIAVPIPFDARVEAIDRYTIPLFGNAPDSGMWSGVSEPMVSAAREPHVSLGTLLILAWIAGVVVLVVPVLAGLWEMRRLRRGARPWRQLDHLSPANIARAAGVNRRIDVLMHDGAAGPMTCGLLRPAIILPADASDWPDDDVTRALVHELEHVRRADWPMHCLARIVCALYWFHPLVWIAWREIVFEAERACDDAVLVRADAESYAEQLLSLAERLSAAGRYPQLAMANSRDLSRRVLAVLDDAQQRGRVGGRCLSGVVAGATVLMAVLTPLNVVGRETSQAAAGEEFEVASVKPNLSVGQGVMGVEFLPGGRVSATRAPLALLIAAAYNVPVSDIDKGLSLLGAGRFDVDARAGASALPPDASERARNRQLQTMLQSLLTQRFKLTMHTEAKETPLYALVIAKNGPRLKPSPPGRECPAEPCGSVGGGPTSGLQGRDSEMSALADTLSLFLDRKVLDRTGLQGRFDIDVPAWTGRDASSGRPAPDPSDPSIFTVLEEQLGLKLEATRGPRDIYVVDHVEAPTPD